MKKFWVLFLLFIVPLLFYIFLTSGTINFSKSPIVTHNVQDIEAFKAADSTQMRLKGKISVVCFLGKDLLVHKTNALNLNEKIYKRFYQYSDFQMIALMPDGVESQVAKLKKELGYTTDVSNWHFLYGKMDALQKVYKSFNSGTALDSLGYSPLVFIVDKELNLRGRLDDEDVHGTLFGYDASIVSPLHKKMVDDIKVLLAEYRRALREKKHK